MIVCVECGAEVPGVVHGACVACFTTKHPLVLLPDAVDVELCAHCDARHVGAHWVDAEEGAPLAWLREDAVRAAVQLHPEVEDAVLEVREAAEDEKHFRTTVRMAGRVQGVPVEAEAATTVRVRRGVCDRCSRLHGGFYASIIQLRATDRDVTDGERHRAERILDEELRRQMASGNRFAFLAKDEAMHGGHDYYLGDIDAGRNAARVMKDRLGASMSESAKLVGRREGEDVHRVTFLVRIRLFATGDFAETDGKVVQVLNIDRGNAIVLDLERHRRTRVPEGTLKRIGGPEALQEAVLVAAGPGEIQVLDPVSLKTRDLLRPEGFSTAGETVTVLRHEGRLFLAPESSPSITKR